MPWKGTESASKVKTWIVIQPFWPHAWSITHINCFSDHRKCWHSDWSRIASYLAIILSHGVISTGAKFQNECFAFFQCYWGSSECVSRQSNYKENKRCNSVWYNTFQKKYMKFLLIELNSRGDWPHISIRGIKTIVTEWFNNKTNLQENSKAPE